MFTAIIATVFLLAIDQITKYAAIYYLEPVGSHPVIEGVFELAFVINHGASFGILQGGRIFFIVTTPVILIGIVIYYFKLPKAKPHNLSRLSLILIFSGALGNFIDRLRQGYVVDFFHAKIINFPVFNMADTFIVIGTILLAVLFLFVIKDEKKINKIEADGNSESDENENADAGGKISIDE